jgi:hypothetical protein
MVTADRIAGRPHIPCFGALRSAAERAAVGFGIADKSGGRADRRDDQKTGNVIANDQFASPTDIEMTSASVKVFRCRPQTEVRLGFGGRRRKTSKGRNRDEGTCVGAARAMGI